jgi:hypothetical protein
LYQARPFDTRYALLGDYDFLLNQVLGRQVVYKHIPVLVAEYSAGGRSEREQARRLAERQLVLRAYFSPQQRLFYEMVRLVGHGTLYVAVRLYAWLKTLTGFRGRWSWLAS